MTRILILSLIVALGPCIALGANAGPATFWTGNPTDVIGSGEPPIQTPLENLSLDVGDPVDFDAAMVAGADYLKGMQADITEDNAGNGNPDVPDDPDDGGWDWRVTSPPAPFSHTTAASSTNLYGATVMGLFSAYLESGDATHFTAMQDAADRAVAAGVDTIRTGADMKFLMLFNDLYSSEVAPTTVYEDAAKAKYDGRITAWGGSATALAEYIRDARAGQGYENGIIAWDIGIYAVVAQMLYDRFGGTYDVDADDIAEVLWQDSYNDNPGYFDIVDDAGWDPTYATYDYYWYSLGITGLIDAFSASGAHTSELPGLLTILLDCQFTGGGISFSYGANTDDEDWQSTAYAMISLGNYDQATYQMEINWMGYWLGATQDASGGWVYSSGNHYPEVGGECTHGLYFTSNALADVIVDDNFTSQADVDVYNTANGTSYVWGYDAFATIQEGIDAINGSTVSVLAGTYYETLNITTAGLNIVGEDRATVIIDPTGLATNNAGIYVAADNVTLQSLTLQSTVTNSLPRYGIKFGEVDGCTLEDVTARDVYRSGIDALGASNLTITNVESKDNGGHGLSLVDCNNVSVTDIIFNNNGWQNVSVATWGNYTPLGTSGIVFAGTNSFGDLFQLEMGDYNNPGFPPAGAAIITYSTNILDGADVTVQASDFGFALHGEQDDSPDQVRIWFFSTLANAAIVPGLGGGGHWTGNDMYIESLTDGTQLYVTPGCSIQAAVDAADPGDFINVSAGTYVEALLIDKPLTLLGATAGVNKNGYTVPAAYAWDDAIESIIMHPDPAGGYTTIVDIYDTDDVTFDGFVVQELSASGNLNSSLLRVYAHSRVISNIEVINSIIGPNTNTVSQDGTHGRLGLYIVNHPYNDNGVVSSTFAGNKIFDCKGNGNNIFLWTSYYAYGAPGPASMAGTVIEDNEIYGSHRSGMETAGGFSDLVIRNNEIYDNSQLPGDDPNKLKYGHGLLLIRGSSDRVSDPLTAYGPVDLTIEGNNIYGNSKSGIYMGPKNDGISITNNTIHDNGWDGVMVDLVGNYWNPQFEPEPVDSQYACFDCSNDISAFNNSIYGNGTAGNSDAEFGIQVNGDPTNGFVFDASGNWWSDLDPSDDVSGDVDYTPWLANGTDTDPGTVGFQGDFSTLWVDDDSPQAGATTRIQEGVDLVSGSTVYVNDGTYGADPATGRGVYITTDGLSLIGESQAGTIIDGAIGGVGSSGSYWPKGIHVQANNITIQNFTIQGFTGDLVSSGGYGVLHRDYAHDTPTEGYIFYDGCSVDHVTVHSCYSVVYALCFTNLTVADCYLHDNYSDGMFIARGSDGAIIHDNIVTNSGDQGIWVGKCWSGLDPSDNATIYNNTVNGAREGGICFVGSDVAEIYGNSITNSASEGWSVGALNLKDGPTNVNAYENRIFNNDGAWNGYSGLGHGVGIDGGAGNINLYDNAIYGNTGLGVYNASTKASSGTWEMRLIEDELPSTPEHMTSGSSDKGTRGLIMAEDNWWGSFDGPEDLTGTDEASIGTCFDVSTMINAVDELGNGLGNGVSDDVDYCPWASGLYLSPDEILYHCSGNFTFDAGIDVAVTDMKVGAFKFEYDVNITYVNVTTSLTGDVILQHQVVGSNPTRTKDTLFVDIGFGSGESLDGPATLFTVEMNSNTDFCNGTPIDMFYALVKDINDDPITLPLPVPINLIADCEDPDVWVNSPAEDGHYNTAPILDIEAYDNCDLDAVYYQVDGCGGTWIPITTGLSGQNYNNTTWTFPDFSSVSEGQHCIYFRVTDDATRENFDKCDADSAWCFVKDTENPEPPENFMALPGHNKVLMSWDASPSGDVVRYQIQRIGWAGYPQYGPPSPSYPLDPTVGTTVYNASGLDHTDTQGLENATRDIYYYSIFAFDAAGNFSVNVNPPTPGTGTRDRATSYWLGDIAGDLPPTHGAFDGFVYFADLDFFTLTYYLSTGDPGFDPHSDIGPTVAGSAGDGPDKAKGLPEPDGTIDINDLWVFATNFNTVDDSKLRKPVFVGQPVPNNTGLRIVQRHDGRDLHVELYLDNVANNVKLLEAEISFDMSMLAYNGADQLISASSGNVPVFFHVTDRKDKVYVTAGALGSNVTFEGSGLIADVRFLMISERPAHVSLTGVMLRDADNNEIVPDIIPTDDLEASGDESSLTYDLKQNVPNPFNPTTTISYSVPTGTHVSVKIYNVMGQLVKTLVNDYRSAGRHEITWHGRNEAGEDAASGVYFYRFQTSEYSKTVKMTLVK